ncbi:MBL fold metallo-hydrolase [Kineococcus sp. SYSU DK005]|uniref:MBL fold metallo-hydrolase n=1 Tax=Kineococcus sp. SYSU DK005 TaxID=3383126 RepID=UPI003D7C95D2
MKDVRITHIGGPTVLLEAAGWRILTDPTFDAPGRRYSFGWGTGSPKITGPSIPAEDIGPIDLVLLSHHHHADNLDDTGRQLLDLAGAVITTLPAARQLQGRCRGLLPWQETTLTTPGRQDLTITATPCRHGPRFSRPIAGAVIGFALSWPGQEHGVLWMTGDTVLYHGVREVPARLCVDTVLLHLGRVQFPTTGRTHYSMTAQEAVELCTLMRPRTIVPVHYEGWGHFHEGRADVEHAFAAAPADLSSRLHWLPLASPAPTAVRRE